MARMTFCVKDKNIFFESIKNELIKHGNYQLWINDLAKVINEYNYSVSHHNMWMSSKAISHNNKAVENVYNAIVSEIQSTGTSIYSKSAETAKWQAETIFEAVTEYAMTLDEKTRKSILKKLDTRMRKMM